MPKSIRFDDLPEDVLFVMVGYLSYADIISLCNTSRYFRTQVSYILRRPLTDIALAGIVPNFRLLPHQETILMWMKHRERDYETSLCSIPGGIVAADMGLGKTITTVVHTLANPVVENPYPTLVVVSLTLMTNWKLQLDQFFTIWKGDRCYNSCPTLFFHKDYCGTDVMRKMTSKKLKNYKFVITTPEVLVKIAEQCSASERVEVLDERYEKKRVLGFTQAPKGLIETKVTGLELIYTIEWPRVFFDEIHHLSNPSTRKASACMSISATFRWGLSGTLIKNGYKDFFSILKVVGLEDPQEKSMWKSYSFMHLNCNQAIISMTCADAGIAMPELTNIDVVLQLSLKEREVYQMYENRAVEMYRAFKADSKSTGFAHVFSMIQRCRQVCIAAYLVTPESKGKRNIAEKFDMPKESKRIMKWVKDAKGDSGLGSTKIRKCMEIFGNIPKDDKIVFFSSYTSALMLLRDALHQYFSNEIVCYIDGKTSPKDRERRFWYVQNHSRARILLVNYTIGGVGINLLSVNHVVPMEPWWTNSVKNQAITRAWRFGQKKHVYAYNLFIENSVEDRIRAIADEKQEECDAAFVNTKASTKPTEGLDIGRILGLRV